MKHTVPVEIRYSDIDMNEHVNNAVYFTLMENARTVLLKEELVEYMKEDIVFIVSEASCKYKQPILLTDKVVCELEFEMLTPLRMGITYLFKSKEKLHATGRTTLVMVNQNTGKPIRIPDKTRKWIEGG